MKHSNIKLYRTLRKTPQSRSIRITLNSGFTLIELLVVVAIISLLTTIVLGAISDARVKARNSAKNSLVMEYIKALEMYRGNDPNGLYPRHIGQETSHKCIGYAESGDNCYGDSLPGSTVINNAFASYMPGDFSHRGSVISSIGNNLNGVQYTCKDTTCNQYRLIWILEKQVSQCVSGATPTPFLEQRRCTYPESN